MQTKHEQSCKSDFLCVRVFVFVCVCPSLYFTFPKMKLFKVRPMDLNSTFDSKA